MQGATQYLLYDGQGSVRHHADGSGNLIAYSGCDTFSYDAYGHRVDPLKDSVNEGLFYTGEQWDNSAQQYYLRARWYDPLNGRFNRIDPYAGNNQDPQSLHKYLYCHANPVNGIDPSGQMSLSNLLAVTGIIALTISIMLPTMHGAYKRAKSIATQKNQTSIFNAIFKGAFTWIDWKQVMLGFGSGAGAGAINALDTLTFRLVNPLHEYRDELWRREGLQESWVGTTTNVFAWAGTTSLYAAAAVWTWNAMGGGTMDIAVKYTGEPRAWFHFQYGSNGIWQEAFGRFGSMPIKKLLASKVEGSLLTGIPVLYPKAIMGSGTAYSCLTATLRALGRGWGF